MACAFIQCKITNRIDLNLICLCLSVAIQHVQATRLIYSVRNVFAKTNLQEVFSIYMSNIIQIILTDLKTSLNFKSCFFKCIIQTKMLTVVFFSFIALGISHMYKLFQTARERGKQVGKRDLGPLLLLSKEDLYEVISN